MRKILILGAGRGQVGLIKGSKDAGYHTIVASIKGNYPGFAFADEIEYIDILDKEAVKQVAEKHQVEGVASCCIDLPMRAQGYVNDALGFKGVTEQAAILSVNKSMMKEAMIANGVTTPLYRKISTVEECAVAIGELTMPVIIKAVDLAGSKGLNVVHDKKDATEAFKKSMAATGLDYCIVEEFIEGYKIGCNALVANGKVQFILPCGDITIVRNTVIPVGHYIPLELTDEETAEVHRQMEMAIESLGLTDCAINADIMIRDGKAYIIEITGRMGANGLPELNSIYYNLDMYRLIAELAMGDFREEDYPQFKKPGQPCAAEMLIADSNGIVKNLPETDNIPDYVKDLIFFVKPGEDVAPFSNTSDCIGQLVVSGDNIDQCVERLNEMKAKIQPELA